mgnify:CR=1 FL=1
MRPNDKKMVIKVRGGVGWLVVRLGVVVVEWVVLVFVLFVCFVFCV